MIYSKLLVIKFKIKKEQQNKFLHIESLSENMI